MITITHAKIRGGAPSPPRSFPRDKVAPRVRRIAMFFPQPNVGYFATPQRAENGQ